MFLFMYISSSNSVGIAKTGCELHNTKNRKNIQKSSTGLTI